MDWYTGKQLKAARILAGAEEGLSQIQLADLSGVSVGTIRRMESSGASLVPGLPETIQKIHKALAKAGVDFIGSDSDGGPGVRARLPRRTHRNR